MSTFCLKLIPLNADFQIKMAILQKKADVSVFSENKSLNEHRRNGDEELTQSSTICQRSNVKQDEISLLARMKTYLKSYYFVEFIVFFLLTCALVGSSRFSPQYERPLPYQVTSSGEVLLDPSLTQVVPKDIISGEIFNFQ